jgi:predicted nucleic-acid-binding protein
MNLKKCAEILGRKNEQYSLAHLYLIRFNSKELDFKKMVEVFVESFFKKNLFDHPDLLIIEKDQKENNFKVDDEHFKFFLDFINYKPIEFNRKLIFINEAHLISVPLANKLLKTFEEAQDFYTIFLVSEIHQEILPTIKSRSIEILLKDEIKKSNTHIEVTQQGISEICLEIKKNAESEKEYIQKLIENALNDSKFLQSIEKQDTFICALKEYQESKVFNVQLQTRLTSLLL